MSCAASSFDIGARLENECVDSPRLRLFGGSEKPSIDADALPGRQEIPSFFGDGIAVLETVTVLLTASDASSVGHVADAA